MKKLLALALVLSCIQFSFAQSPQKMSYQSVIRDGAGELVVESPVGIQVSILQGSAAGAAVYVETHADTTNLNGLAALEIGTGTLITGTFAAIDWGNGPYFVKTEIDASGGTSYSMSATSELLSVPYALHARTADNVSDLIIQEPLAISLDVVDETSYDFLYPSQNEGGFVATFENTNTGNGDGIKIKLGKQRTEITPSFALTPEELEEAEQIRQLLNAATPTSEKQAILESLIEEGIEGDVVTIIGLALGAGNVIIEVINEGLGLPLNVTAPINTALDYDFGELINVGLGLPLDVGLTINNGLDLPWDITGPINSGLNLPYGVSMPYIGSIEIVPPFPPLEVPGIPVNNGSTVLKIPGIPSNVLKIPTIPDFVIPAIPTIPDSIEIGGVTITVIELTDLEAWGIPDFVLTDLNGEVLSDENEFIRFSDVDDSKMGSIRALNKADWAQNCLNAVFLGKLKRYIRKGVDKRHKIFHIKDETAYKLWDYAHLGVEYSSSFGDYAEWLERADPDERMRAGSIVGVVGGKISKDLTNAEQVMVVSHSPIVLGNVPEEGSTHLGNNIAFVGQVPVKVMGAVHTGDYIIGNPSTPGYGYAKDPAEMSIEEVNLAVGRSWEDSPGEGPKLVNTVVGVHNGDYVNILKSQAQRLETANDRLGSAESKVESLESNMESVLQILSIEANSK
jgi:hypothetical protein